MNGSPLRVFHRRNLVTFLSLSAGLAAMASASSSGPHVAGALLALAALADTFDGRFARLFVADETDRALGVELDSLVDAVTFGVAPVISVAATNPPEAGWSMLGWWLAAGAYVAAAVSRLAFYNTRHEHSTGFVGLPVPVSALIWSSALFASPAPHIAALIFAVLAAAMVLPYAVPRPRGLALATFACWPLLLIGSHLLSL